MSTTLSSESANWTLPSYPKTLTSTLPNYEESGALRVNREGVKNYIKNRGTLNIGNWAIEGRRTSTVTDSTGHERNILRAPPPKVKGAEAERNYLRGRNSAPNLIGGVRDSENPHNHLRVKNAGRANYEKNHSSQMKLLFENYGKLPLDPPPLPHTQGEMATNLYHIHKEGRMARIFHDYGHLPLSPKPIPHVKGGPAEDNLQKGRGHSHLLEHGYSYRAPTPEPHVKGGQAHTNYDMAQGHNVSKLFHEYGKLPQSARVAPKVKYGGIENQKNAQGDAMRKALSQCPPSIRYLERPQSVPLWS